MIFQAHDRRQDSRSRLHGGLRRMTAMALLCCCLTVSPFPFWILQYDHVVPLMITCQLEPIGRPLVQQSSFTTLHRHWNQCRRRDNKARYSTNMPEMRRCQAAATMLHIVRYEVAAVSLQIRVMSSRNLQPIEACVTCTGISGPVLYASQFFSAVSPRWNHAALHANDRQCAVAHLQRNVLFFFKNKLIRYENLFYMQVIDCRRLHN